MIKVDIKVKNNIDAVQKAADRAAFKNLSHASARIAKDAKFEIIKDEEPSPPGTPPHTKGRGGHNLKGAIRFDANKDDAYIGPMYSYVGEVGRAHELGEEIHGQDFPERPFMLPALEKNLNRFHKDWKGSITE